MAGSASGGNAYFPGRFGAGDEASQIIINMFEILRVSGKDTLYEFIDEIFSFIQNFLHDSYHCNDDV